MSPRLLYGWCQSIYKKITAEKNEKGEVLETQPESGLCISIMNSVMRMKTVP